LHTNGESRTEFTNLCLEPLLHSKQSPNSFSNDDLKFLLVLDLLGSVFDDVLAASHRDPQFDHARNPVPLQLHFKQLGLFLFKNGPLVHLERPILLVELFVHVLALENSIRLLVISKLGLQGFHCFALRNSC